jgi:hypothetical protein
MEISMTMINNGINDLPKALETIRISLIVDEKKGVLKLPPIPNIQGYVCYFQKIYLCYTLKDKLVNVEMSSNDTAEAFSIQLNLQNKSLKIFRWELTWREDRYVHDHHEFSTECSYVFAA